MCGQGGNCFVIEKLTVTKKLGVIIGEEKSKWSYCSLAS